MDYERRSATTYMSRRLESLQAQFGGRISSSKREIEYPKLHTNVIIATKGLPCTAKSTISKMISVWAKCPLLSMEDFLDAVSMEKGYSAKCPPSPEEADRLQRLAFDVLLKAARRKLPPGYSVPSCCVVVKTRLCSSFELDTLLRLAVSGPCTSRLFVLVECKMKNKHRFRSRLEYTVRMCGHEEWYKARTWDDIENAQDQIDDGAWNDYAGSVISIEGKSPMVIKLVVDPFDDLNMETYEFKATSSTLLNAIRHLMLSSKISQYEPLLLDHEDACDSNEDKKLSDEEVDLEFVMSSYYVVQYDILQQYLFKRELKASKYRERSKYICAIKGGDCVFKFLVLDDRSYGLPTDEKIYCGVCEDLVHGGQSTYTCYFASLLCMNHVPIC